MKDKKQYYCYCCQKEVDVKKKKINLKANFGHLILTFVTIGGWLPFWIIDFICGAYSCKFCGNEINLLNQDKIKKDINMINYFLYNKDRLTDIMLQVNFIMFNTIVKHFKTLNTKYEQLIYEDDYGNIMDSAWNKEFEYFLQNVLIKELEKISNIHENFHLCCKNISVNASFPDNLEISEILNYDPQFIVEFSEDEKTIEYNRNYISEIINKLTKNKENFMEQIYENEIFGTVKPSNYLNVNFLFPLAFDFFNKVKRIDDFSSNNQSIHAKILSPYDFETECMLRLKKLGFNAKTTPKSGDQGVDVIAEKNNVKIVIQAKLYSKPVGNKAVQEVIAGRDFYKADFGFVISNQSFTSSAKQLANNCNIKLLHIDKISDVENCL